MQWGMKENNANFLPPPVLLTQLILKLLWSSVSFGTNFDASVSCFPQGCFLDTFLPLLLRVKRRMGKGDENKHSPHCSPEVFIHIQGTLKGTGLLSSTPRYGVARGKLAHGKVTRNRAESTNGKLGGQYPKMDIGVHLLSLFFCSKSSHMLCLIFFI